jgi:hypothetical protein
MMFRRNLLQRLGGLLLFGSSGLLASDSKFPALDTTPGSEAAATIRTIVDLLVPADDLPGAVELGIDRQILLAATADPEFAALLAGGIRWFEAAARSHGKQMRFAALPAADQIAIAQRAEAGQDTDGGRLFVSLRRRTMTIYYTHPRVVASFPYAGAPQPQGFPDFEQAPREQRS